MRNLIKLATVFAIFIGSFAFGQKYINDNFKELKEKIQNADKKKIKISCVTYSCCGIGPFGVEIWSHKVCSYIVYGKRVGVINLKYVNGANYDKSEIQINEDVVLEDKDQELEKE